MARELCPPAFVRDDSPGVNARLLLFIIRSDRRGAARKCALNLTSPDTTPPTTPKLRRPFPSVPPHGGGPSSTCYTLEPRSNDRDGAARNNITKADCKLLLPRAEPDKERR